MSSAAELRRSLWHLRKGGWSGLRGHLKRRQVTGGVRSIAKRSASGDLTFDPWPVPEIAPRRAGLRVAVVLDDFSASAFSFEWVQVAITPENWRSELTERPVDLLFVESAWAGNGGAWQYCLTSASGVRAEFRELVQWCRSRGIPTVFWNKEDPVHHDDFLEAAGLFDHVFTTDSNMLQHYRDVLGHDRVAVLPFAAQVALHNPVRPAHGFAERDVAFGGMYFAHRHPERREQMDMLLGAASAASGRMPIGLEIFSRQLGGEERYQFPAPLDAHVVGSLDYQQMLTAYRSYKVFLNVNTVVDSPTMCARRIYEITASGTPVVSTPSPAIDSVFAADEVLQVSDGREAELSLRALVNSAELRERMVHRAQRTVWSSHTYTHRVDEVLESVGLTDHLTARREPRVTALVSTIRPAQVDHVLATLAAQQGASVQLALLTHGWDVPEAELRARARDVGIEDLVLLQAGRDVPLGACLNRLVAAADGELVAKIDDDDVYGPHYLSDQAHAMFYSGADVVGKQAHFVHLVASKVTALRFAHREHRYTDFVMGPTIVTSAETARRIPFPEVGLGEDSGFLKSVGESGGRIYSADRFGFVQVRGGSAHTWNASDAEILASSVVQVSGSSLEHAFV